MFRLYMNNGRMATLAGICLVVGAALVISLPAMSGGFLVDDELLTQNPLIKSPNGLFRIWCTTEPTDYWPITNTLFWIEWRLWGTNPTGYHVVNLILHAVDSLLIWAVLRQLSIPGAFLAALLFAVHPVNVESVAWISQCKNLLAMLFFLFSILAWLKADKLVANETAMFDRSRWRGLLSLHQTIPGFWYFLSLLAFILAMLSKGSVAILPLVLLLIAWWQRKKIDSRAILRTAPFFLIAAVLTLVNIWFQTHGETGSALRDVTFVQRLLGAGAIVWFYLFKALWPVGLLFVYPQWKIDATNPAWWLPLLAALAVTGFLVWRRNSRWAKWVRPILFAWSYFCITLLPVMGFIAIGYMKYSPVADHYQHLAIIGVMALWSAAVYYAYDQIGYTNRSGSATLPIANLKQGTAAVAVALVLGSLIYLSRQQSALYGDSFRLYQYAAENNPENWLTQYDLGYALIGLGRREEAAQQFHKAAQLKPDEPNTYNSLGNLLTEQGKFQEAILQYQQALQMSPRFAAAQYNLAMALAEQADWQQAIDHYQQAIQLEPDWAEAHFHLGLALSNTGRRSEAVIHFQQAIDAKPDYADAYVQLALALIQQGHLPDAIKHLEQAVHLEPNSAEAHNNLGIALKQAGRIIEAIAQYKQAVQLNTDFAEPHNNLANALLQNGEIDAAIEHFQKARQLQPAYAQACIGLAMAYQQAGRPTEAVAAGQKAVELARAAGQIELAQKIEAWLISYRADPANSQTAVPSPNSKASPTH